MSDLYTRFMEWIMPFLQANWQLFLIAVGALFLLGGIFNWKWTWDPNGHNLFGWNAFVYRHFGEKGARVNTGISGVIIILCAVALWRCGDVVVDVRSPPFCAIGLGVLIRFTIIKKECYIYGIVWI